MEYNLEKLFKKICQEAEFERIYEAVNGISPDAVQPVSPINKIPGKLPRKQNDFELKNKKEIKQDSKPNFQEILEDEIRKQKSS